MQKLIALAIIAATTLAIDSPEIAAGASFDAPDDLAASLIEQGLAKPAEAAPAPPAPTGKEKPVKARVLLACVHGQPDDVVTLSASAAAAAEKAGQVDTNKAAVAYALSLQA